MFFAKNITRKFINNVFNYKHICTSTRLLQVKIEASPQICLHDVPTTICISGLDKNQPVTARATLIDENGKLVSL